MLGAPALLNARAVPQMVQCVSWARNASTRNNRGKTNVSGTPVRTEKLRGQNATRTAGPVGEVLSDTSAPGGHGLSAGRLERAQVIYVGAQKCFINLYSDLSRGITAPVLAYLSPQVLAKDRRHRAVVGDDVLVVPSDHGSHRVTEVLPRRNLLLRCDSKGRARALASNLDQLLICCSFGSPPFSSLVLDRVIVAAAAANIQPVVVLNKVDLANRQTVEDIAQTYAQAGFPMCLTKP